MTVTFAIHLEQARDGVVWWAESEDARGLTAAADSLVELRRLIEEAVALHLGAGVETRLELVASEVGSRGGEPLAAPGNIPAASARRAVLPPRMVA